MYDGLTEISGRPVHFGKISDEFMDMHPDARGYTLIELIVVVAVISILLFFSVPRFQTSIFQDDVKSFSRWITLTVKSLKQQAVREQKTFLLHIGLDDGQLWVTHDAMTEEEFDQARESAYQMPGALQIMDVEYPNYRKITSGHVAVRFFAKGYSDRVLIHIEDEDDRRVTCFVEPFLSGIRIKEAYVGYEG